MANTNNPCREGTLHMRYRRAHVGVNGVGPCQVHAIANGVFDAGIDVEAGVSNLAWATMN